MKIAILQLTKNCNQNCFYCTRDIDEKDESTTELKNHVDKLDKDTEEIIITGGEPSLNKDFYEIVEYAAKKIPKVHIQTNGINFSDLEECKRLIKTGISSILLALPSHKKDVVEKIANKKDLFEKKVKALKNLSMFEDIKLGVVFVVNNYNHKDFSEYVRFISDINRDIYIQVTYMIRYTDTDKIKPETVAKYSEFKPELDKGITICQEKNIEYRLDGFPLCFVKEHLDRVSDIKTRKYDFTEDFIDKKTKNYDSDNYVGKEHIKPKSCKRCKLNEQCKGIYEYYAELFGTEELRPIL